MFQLNKTFSNENLNGAHLIHSQKGAAYLRLIELQFWFTSRGLFVGFKTTPPMLRPCRQPPFFSAQDCSHDIDRPLPMPPRQATDLPSPTPQASL